MRAESRRERTHRPIAIVPRDRAAVVEGLDRHLVRSVTDPASRCGQRSRSAISNGPRGRRAGAPRKGTDTVLSASAGPARSARIATISPRSRQARISNDAFGEPGVIAITFTVDPEPSLSKKALMAGAFAVYMTTFTRTRYLPAKERSMSKLP